MRTKTLRLGVLFLLLPGAQVHAQQCEAKGAIETLGEGTPGTLGVPLLSTAGVPLQDKALWFELTGGLPGAHGCILGSLNESPIDLPAFGATLYPAAPLFLEVFDLDGQGAVSPLLPLSTVPDLCGIEFVSQTVILDPVAMGGVAFSRAMRIRFAGPADGPLFLGQNFPAGDGGKSVAIADLNRDGVPDLAVANYQSWSVSVLLGLGDGTFEAAQSFFPGGRPISVASDDLNGDGAPDLALAIDNAAGLSVMLGLGDGTLAVQQSYTVGPGNGSVAIGDLNGDGVPDLVAAKWNLSGIVSVLLGLGDGAFSSPQGFPAGDFPVHAAIRDLDGDGALDLAVTGQSFGVGAYVSVLLGQGNGVFWPPQQFPVSNVSSSLAIGDLNGDGVPDLAVSTGDDNVSVLLGLGDGTFAAEQITPAGFLTRDVAIGDLDGDGVPDLAIANPFAYNAISVLSGHGDGTFATQVAYICGDGPDSLAIGDLDGNGVADLAVGNSSSGDVTVLLNQLLE